MKKIYDILKKCDIIESVGRNDRSVSNLVFDSRKSAEDVAFFAVRGTQVDGHDYIYKAIEQGCRVVVCERLPENVVDDVTYYVVENTAKVLGYAASEFYGRPSEKLHHS